MTIPSDAADRPHQMPERMDRFSDWLGARFLLENHQLSPKHPLKVSLVMGLLGGLSGWLTVLPWGFAAQSSGVDLISIEFAMMLLASLSMFGLVVLAPISLWFGRSLIFAIMVNGAASVLVQLAGIVALISIRFPGTAEMDFVNVAIPCAVVSIGFACVVSRLASRRTLWVLLSSVVMGTLIGGAAISVIDLAGRESTKLWRFSLGMSGDLALLFFSGFAYALFHSVLACCYGIVLWETGSRTARDAAIPEPVQP